MPDDDGDDFRSDLRQFAQSEIERREVRRQAKMREEERQRDFIVAFHEVKRNVVEPMMREAEEELRDAGLDRVDVGEFRDGECIQLSIYGQGSDEHSLCYAIPRRRYDRVEVRLSYRRTTHVTSRQVGDITPEQVRSDIKTLLAFAQGRKPSHRDGWRQATSELF